MEKTKGFQVLHFMVAQLSIFKGKWSGVSLAQDTTLFHNVILSKFSFLQKSQTRIRSIIYQTSTSTVTRQTFSAIFYNFLMQINCNSKCVLREAQCNQFLINKTKITIFGKSTTNNFPFAVITALLNLFKHSQHFILNLGKDCDSRHDTIFCLLLATDGTESHTLYTLSSSLTLCKLYYGSKMQCFNY